MVSKALHGIDPLKDLLSEVLSRLESLEAKVGIAPTHNSSVSFSAPVPNEANLAGESVLLLLFTHIIIVTHTIYSLQPQEKSPPSKPTTVT